MENHLLMFKEGKLKNWHVIYTRPKWERKVDEALKQEGLESFCPLIKVRRQWADRQKVLDAPLFNSYLFVKNSIKEEFIVRKTNGVMNFVYHCGKPAIMKDTEIDNIKYFLTTYSSIETVSIKNISVGDRVQIIEGALYNQEGKVVKVEGKNILMVLENMGCAIITKLPIENVNVLNKAL